MRVFSVVGFTKSGKTTTIENIIRELVARGFSVGTVKSIHYEGFHIDTEGKNTWRHRQAGADTVTALSNSETDVMYNRKLNIYEVLKLYNEDFVILEGCRDAVVPNIAVSREDSEPEISKLTFAVSGCYSNTHFGVVNNDGYDIPIINSNIDIKTLVDLIVEKTPPLMYDIKKECCSHCGYDCREFLSRFLKGEESLDKCVLNQKKVSLKIDGEEIVMVPFVEKLVKNAVLGVVGELKGYKNGSKIQVEFLDD